jgi:hypothetical protein
MTAAPDPVAVALAADPTLAFMSPSERREEASSLLLSAGRDTEAEDPLTLALLVEEAEALDPPEPPTVAPSVHLDPCREDRGDRCHEAIAANGRCMACGARREAEPKAQAVEMPAGLVAPPAAPLPAPERLRTEGEPILARYKAVSNATAQEIGEAIGRGKSSVQAMVTSRYTEILTPEQIRTLVNLAKAQAADLLAFAASMDALPNAEPDAN